MASNFWDSITGGNTNASQQADNPDYGNPGQKYVFWGRNWVPYDPNNPDHKGLPQYDYGSPIVRDSLPYYSQDVSSLLAQLGFTGAAGAQTFGSNFLEPERERAIREALAQLTPEQMRLWAQTLQGRMQDFSNQQVQTQAAQARGEGSQQGLQDAQKLGTAGFGNAAQESAILKAHNATLGHIAKLRAGAGANLQDQIGQTTMQMDDPYKLLGQRLDLITGGFNSGANNNVLQYLGGGEQQRQNGSFLNQLLNAGLNYAGGGGSFGNIFKHGSGSSKLQSNNWDYNNLYT